MAFSCLNCIACKAVYPGKSKHASQSQNLFYQRDICVDKLLDVFV